MDDLVCYRTVGMDVSTSVTGITVLDRPLMKNAFPQLVHMTHVDFSKCDGFWEKVDLFREVFHKLCVDIDLKSDRTHAFVEESLQAFRPGLSSASTLMTLAKFNGIACMIVRDELGITPIPISATSARKTCGVKVQRGTPAKQQTFNQLTSKSGPLAHHSFPSKRQTAKAIASGKSVEPVTWAYDEVDSYVIAWAGMRSLC